MNISLQPEQEQLIQSKLQKGFENLGEKSGLMLVVTPLTQNFLRWLTRLLNQKT
jgi:hypothetical protein